MIIFTMNYRKIFSVTYFRLAKRVNGKVHREAGGTGVNFAKGAHKAGFTVPYVVGVVGGDAIGQQIVKELHNNEITPLLVM